MSGLLTTRYSNAILRVEKWRTQSINDGSDDLSITTTNQYEDLVSAYLTKRTESYVQQFRTQIYSTTINALMYSCKPKA